MRMRIIGGVAVLGAALLPLGLSTTNARPPAVANLKGSCIWQEGKFPTSDQSTVGPATVLATMHFEGSGRMTMDYDANVNGTYSSTNGALGSYSIDSTGHGSFWFISPATNYLRTYDFRVSPHGHTLYTMAQADGTGSVTQRVSTGACVFEDQGESPFSQH